MKVLFKAAGSLILLGCLAAISLTQAYAEANRGKAVPPEKLPKTLGGISPKDYFLPSPEKKVGVVHAMEGTVIVIHPATKEGFFAAEGDPVFEKDSVATLVESKCRIRFADENVVTMGAETEFSVDGFEDRREEGRKTSFFSMAKGKAMFYALRLFRYKETRVTLKTPTTTIGIRGTKFGAHVYYLEDSKTASLPILVADAQNEIGPYLAQAGSGRSVTDCFSVDGVLDVDGRTVHPGQMYNGQTGRIIQTPPGLLNSFNQSTGINTGGSTGGTTGQGGTGSGGQPQASGGGGTGGMAGLGADLQSNLTSVAQNQTGQKTETEQQPPLPPPPPPRRDIGYFAAMLTNNFSEAPYLKDVFVQFEDHRRYEIDSARALGLANRDHYIEGKAMGSPDPGFTDAPYLSRIYLGSGYDSGDLGATSPITDTQLGRNDYMEWGYWTMPTLVTVGSDQYLIDNRAYYVVGQATENLDRLKSLGEVNYAGNAWGTYFSPSGGYNMTGGFTASVNLNSGSISNFALSVADGTRSASIAGASGTIYGYANPGFNNCGHFDINPATGTWLLSDGGTPGTPPNRAAQGALYGPNAEHIGGVWGMYNSSNSGAAGGFQGSRPAN